MDAVELRELFYPLNSQLSINIERLNLEAEKFHIIVGKNGAGKTTLLRILAGVLLAKRGKISLLGNTLPLEAEKIKSLVSWSPEKISLPSGFTLEQIACLGLKKSCIDKMLLYELLDFFLPDIKRSREARLLSSGEQKKLLLIRSLIQGVPLLFLDEPLANLDLGSALQALDFLKKQIMSKNLTLICTMHQLDLALKYGDKIILIDQGRKVCESVKEHREICLYLSELLNIPQTYFSNMLDIKLC